MEEVKQIMLEKLKEMSKVEFDDCANGEYPCICSTMNEIANTLLKKEILIDYSVEELFKELSSRDNVDSTVTENYCINGENMKVFQLRAIF